MFIFFVMVFLGVVLPAQTTFAHDAAIIVPTRLDFDASQAPKNCNDDVTFRNLLGTWVLPDVLSIQADRRLTVRIHRSSTGGKVADVTLVDAAGATLREHQKRYGVKEECFKVLYDTAFAAADLLGAFEKPLPPKPLVCPAPTVPAKPEPCPTSPAPTVQLPRITLSAPFIPRGFVGAGVFLGMTTTNEVSLGPSISLGYVPFSHWPGFHIEFDGAWTGPNTQSETRVDSVPVFGSVCHSHHGLRLCGGLATTFYFVEDAKDVRDFSLSASLRMGIEFSIAGPFSIRSDVFALLPLTQRTTLNAPNSFAAGVVVMGVRSFE